MTIELELTEREIAVARAVACAFLDWGETLTLVEIARVVASDDTRDVGLQQALAAVWRRRLEKVVKEREREALR